MILTPKNWKSFQHYKDRAPSWIKLHKSLLDDFDFCCLPVASRALAPFLWLLASEYEDGKITASLDALSFRLRLTRGELADALSPLIEKGFFDASEPLAECKQDASLEKRREDREEIEEEKIYSTVAKATRRDEQFEEFWKAYPRRGGANPKAPAEKLFVAAVKAGANPQDIIAGAKACAIAETAKLGTEFIPQAVKWLRDKRWQDYNERSVVVPITTKYYAKPDSAQLDAWDCHFRQTKGVNCSRDRNGGWYVDSEWPPGYAPSQREPPDLKMRGMA